MPWKLAKVDQKLRREYMHIFFIRCVLKASRTYRHIAYHICPGNNILIYSSLDKSLNICTEKEILIYFSLDKNSTDI